MNVRRHTGAAFLMGLSLMALTSCVGTETSFSPAKRDIEKDNLVNGDSWTATLIPVGSGTSSGSASMKVEGASFIVEVETSGLVEGSYLQSVRSGTCPNDLGDSILSLDGDLSSEEAGSEMNPSSDVSGNYLYSESTDLSSISTDLAGKIVVIYGTDAETTIPVLCGTIEKEDSVQEGEPVPPTGGGDQDQGQQQQQHQTQAEVYMPESDEE